MRIVIVGLSTLLALPALADPIDAPTRQVHESPTERAVLKIQKATLPAEKWRGAKISTTEGDQQLVRRSEHDSAVDANGKFVRTTRTLTLTAKNGTGSWRKVADDPAWRIEHADALTSTKQLGPSFTATAAKTRLFAPRAKKVELVLLDRNERFPATVDRNGVWEASIPLAPSALYGQRYQYEVDGVAIADPYAQATSNDYGPSIFTNLDAHAWQDAGYDKGSTTAKLAAGGVSEAHVKDMTASPSAQVTSAERGSYTGLRASSVTAHYEHLGVGGIQLLPVQAYDKKSGDRGTFNHWGYMTSSYFAPEPRYASEPANAPAELQSAIDGLHQKKLSVVMDVVYNHTAKGAEIAFNTLGHSYYYRLKTDGTDYNGAGTGNELASERPMVRKLIIDSLRTFAVKYHVDGFRFDLGSLLDKQTIGAIERGLPKRVFLTAEPWAAEWERAKWGKGDLGNSKFTLWNDDFRNVAWSFLGGATGQRDALMNAVAGSVKGYGHGWTQRPTQALNYLESHDEQTIGDRMGGDEKRVLLGSALLLTSQGIPMLGHGQEMMRSKKGIANAHNLDDETSWVDWAQKDKHTQLFEATSTLVALRKRLPQLHYDRPLTDADITWLKPANDRALGYVLPPPRGTKGDTVAVLLNSDKSERVTMQLPAGKWNVVVDGETLQASDKGLRTAEGSYSVPAGCAIVLTRSEGGNVL